MSEILKNDFEGQQPGRIDVMNQISDYPTLEQLGLGKGSIDPAERSDINPELYAEMMEAVGRGEFNIAVDGTVPAICVDGRLDADGNRIDSPSVAGATLGLGYGRVLADRIGRFADLDENALQAETIKELRGSGHKVGVHGDDHGPCGCGACNAAPAIFDHISEDKDAIANAIRAIGVDISDAQASTIAGNADELTGENRGFFAEDRGSVLVAAQKSGADHEELVAAHYELAIALNMRPNTTIDRPGIREKYGPQYDLFVVDAWSFVNAATELAGTGTEEEVSDITGGITMFNVATASHLSASSMPLVVIKQEDLSLAA